MRVWLLLGLVLGRVVAEPRPGHMVHDYYKCQSEFFKDSIKCREEAARNEEALRRFNGGQSSHANTTLCLVMGALMALRGW
jgi:hypothetical protein